VDDRDAAIASEADMTDGHLIYVQDAKGNPTFNIYAWNGKRTHTYVAVVASENRPSPAVYENDDNAAYPQPSFDQFATALNAENGVHGDYLFISNPITVTPDWSFSLIAHAQLEESTKKDFPTCDCWYSNWATTNYTKFQNVAPRQMWTSSLLLGLNDENKLWDEFYGKDDPAAIQRYVDNARDGGLGVGMDSMENSVLSDNYPDLDGTWSYEVYVRDVTTGEMWAQGTDSNAQRSWDDASKQWIGGGGGGGNFDSYQYVVARRSWLDGSLFDVQAITGASGEHTRGTDAVTFAEPCDPDTTTEPLDTDNLRSDQIHYAIVDALTGGLESRMYESVGSTLIDHCSAEYKLVSGGLTALSFAVPELKVSDVTKVAQAERYVYSKVSKDSTLYTKLTSTDLEVRAEAAKDFVTDCAKDNVKEDLHHTVYTLLNKYYEEHPTANGITPEFGDDEDFQPNFCV
jgi:hypothetical protein